MYCIQLYLYKASELMSILINMSHEANQVTNCISLMQNVSTPILETLMNYKNYFVQVAKQTDELYASSLKVFDALDNQSKKVLSGLNKRIRSQKTIKNEEKRSQSPKPANTQPSKVSVKIPCINPEPTLSSKMAQQLIKSSQTMQNAFICFLCFHNRKNKESSIKNYTWLSQTFYISHLKEQHNIVPNFQVVMLSVTGIPFSHVYFHGQLVSLFRNSLFEKYLYILSCYKQPSIYKLYTCSCISNQNSNQQLSGKPIFINSCDFYAHICLKHEGICPKGSSHMLVKYGKEKIHHFRINKGSKIQNNPHLEKIIINIEQAIESFEKYTISSFVIESSPLCRLETISRLNLKWRDAFLPLPNSASNQPTLKQLKQYAKNCKEKTDFVNIEDATEEENKLINLQISLLDPKLYLCGECSYRAKNEEEYISHIYLSHKNIHYLNTHRFIFLNS